MSGANPIGSILNNYRFLDFIDGKKPEDIVFQLRQIKLPYKIISMYFDGKRHIAWINLTMPIRKEALKQENGNG